MECLYWLKDPKAHLVYLWENKNPLFCCVLWQSCGFTVANRVHANSNLLMSINRGREHFLRAKSSNFLPTYGAKCDRLKRGQKAGGGWTLPGVNLEPVLLLSVGCVVYLSANHNSYFIHSDNSPVLKKIDSGEVWRHLLTLNPLWDLPPHHPCPWYLHMHDNHRGILTVLPSHNPLLGYQYVFVFPSCRVFIENQPGERFLLLK